MGNHGSDGGNLIASQLPEGLCFNHLLGPRRHGLLNERRNRNPAERCGILDSLCKRFRKPGVDPLLGGPNRTAAP